MNSVSQLAKSPLSVGVLVLNYNTWQLALRALNAAISLEDGSVTEYVLFDDGSPSPPPEMDRRIQLVKGGVNRGFARALKQAFAAMKSDIVVLFDSDAYPLAPFVNQVRQHFEQDARLGQLGFQAEDSNGVPTESYLREPSQWSLILGQALYARVPKSAPQPSNLCIITGCMATRLDAYKQVGGFDESLDFLDVDVDYSMRLRRAGWQVAVDRSLRAFHVGGGTTQKMRDRVLHFYKSRWRLLRKHGLMPSPRLARAIILVRLELERSIIRLFGKRIFPSPEILEDKVLGRRTLLLYCRENFR